MQKIILLCLVLIFLCGCENDDPQTSYAIKYEVTGTAALVNITYTNDFGFEFSFDTHLPWYWGEFYTIEGNQLSLIGRNLTAEGDITVIIYVDGEIADQDTCSGAYCIASAFKILK